jgi:fructose-specific phosphotransferase system IIC component
MKDWLIKLRQYLLSGVSFAIPFIACGGIMIAAGIAINSHYAPNDPAHDFSKTPKHLLAIIKFLLLVGGTAFDLMPLVLSAYIANAIAGKPGLVAGFVGGYFATHIPVPDSDKLVSAGFLGALVSGLAAGYVVHWMKQIRVPKFIRPIMPILIIPIVSASIIAYLMLYVVGHPIAESFDKLNHWLTGMGNGNKVVLATILGCMIAFDMGGPVNKTAFFFGSGLIAHQNYTVMGAVAAAICVPPIGLGLATMLSKKLWTEAEKEAGVAAFAMGFVGITEGAIPFAASDPLRVIPSIMFGSAVASVIAMLGGVGDHAPHGGPIVILVVDHPVMYVVAITVGVVVTALTVNLIKASTNGSDVEAEKGSPATLTV